jgi:hypothetical protein
MLSSNLQPHTAPRAIGACKGGRAFAGSYRQDVMEGEGS